MSLRYAILGLLDLTSMTGYDLKKAIDSTVTYFWMADQSQIYRTLGSLVAEGLSTVTVVEQLDRPNRKEHHITDAGRAELRRWLASPLEPEVNRDGFLARVFFAGAADRSDVNLLLEQRRTQAEASLAALNAIDAGGTASLRGQFFRTATLRHGIAHLRTELAWLDELAQDLHDGRDLQDGADLRLRPVASSIAVGES